MNANDQEVQWSTRYRDAGERYVFGTEPNRWLRDHATLFTPGQQVLAVADGEGRNAVWLAGLGTQVTATDISPVAQDKARALARAKGVTVDFIQADAATWHYPAAAFDCVVGIFIQFAGPDQRPALFAGMQRALKPGGRLLLLGYTPKQLEYRTGGPSAVANLYTAELLQDAFAGLEIEELTEYEDELSEGSGHAGRSALIGLVARKPGR